MKTPLNVAFFLFSIFAMGCLPTEKAANQASDAAHIDSAQLDSIQPDSVQPDSDQADASTLDIALPDTALPDTALPDAALPDAALPDTVLPDTTLPDTVLPDTILASGDATSVADAGTCLTAANCDDGDPCTQGQLVMEGTCGVLCIQTTIVGHISADGCCLDPETTYYSQDNDCPRSALYASCLQDSDCSSGICESFDSYPDYLFCTQSCRDDLINIAGDCPQLSEDGWYSACLSRPRLDSARDPVCTGLFLGDDESGYLGQQDTLSGTLASTEDIDLYHLHDTQGVPTTATITITPSTGLDPLLDYLGPTLVYGHSCNNGGGSQTEVCHIHLQGQGERVFISVRTAQGSGTYTISATYTEQ